MANIGVDEFVSNITKGFASPNKYLVSFSSPVGGNDKTVSMMCNVANLPARSLKTYENRHYGVPFQLPFTVEYGDITFSFLTQIGFKERNFFDKWQEEVIDTKSGILNFYDDYKGDIKIEHLSGENGSTDYTVQIWDAYPTNLDAIALGYSMQNDTIISSVTFSYRNWKTI